MKEVLWNDLVYRKSPRQRRELILMRRCVEKHRCVTKIASPDTQIIRMRKPFAKHRYVPMIALPMGLMLTHRGVEAGRPKRKATRLLPIPRGGECLCDRNLTQTQTNTATYALYALYISMHRSTTAHVIICHGNSSP